MPVDNGLWLDDQEVVAPRRPELAEPDPLNAIAVRQSGSGVSSKSDVELVAENEVLKGHITTGAEAGKQTAEEQGDEMKHPAGYHPVPQWAAGSNWTAFFPPSSRAA